MYSTILVVGIILMLTLFVSPGEGDALSRLLPGTLPVIGSESGYDACVGGIPCEDGHAFAFIALGASLSLGVLAGSRGWRAALRAAAALALIMLFATADEVAQHWAGRDASLDDWLADVSGALLGIVMGSQLARLLVQRR
jgi:hypothetical protein